VVSNHDSALSTPSKVTDDLDSSGISVDPTTEQMRTLAMAEYLKRTQGQPEMWES